LSAVGFAAFDATACEVVRAGALLAAGGGVDASCSGVAADAEESLPYSHAEPIAGTKPKMANAIANNIRFMVSSSFFIVTSTQFALNENTCQQAVHIALGTTCAKIGCRRNDTGTHRRELDVAHATPLYIQLHRESLWRRISVRIP
jgi:hypothetical protein